MFINIANNKIAFSKLSIVCLFSVVASFLVWADSFVLITDTLLLCYLTDSNLSSDNAFMNQQINL